MRKISIAGIGAVSPTGATWPETWQGLLAGGIRSTPAERIPLPLPAAAPAAMVSNLERTADPQGHGPATHLLMDAASQIGASLRSYRILAATNHGDADLELAASLTGGPPGSRVQEAAFQEGDCVWLSSACTGGLHLLWLASLEAAEKDGPWLIVAGDALSSIGIAGFQSAGATGQRAPQPFREGSGGMLVAEGAVAIELRKDEIAHSPRVLGIAATCDAGHPTHPDPTGQWLERCIREALGYAACSPVDIAAVVAHGTGTRLNDSVESMVLANVFGSAKPVVTSLKGTVGHMMSAAGLLNVAAAAEIWRTGRVPPCVGQGAALGELVLADGDSVIARESRILVLASGFGGNNVAAVVG